MTFSDPVLDAGTAHRPVVRQTLTAAAILVVLFATGCASEQASGPREYLDERTAATITVAGEVMVFAYARPELGVNARDYVTLTAVDVNTSGRHALHLVGFAWSTLDKRGVAEGDSRYEVVADDRTLPLQAMPEGFRSIGLNEPPIPVPSRAAVPLTAPVTQDQLQFLRDTREARVVRIRSGVMERFELWRDPGR
jgi:hypothetical protein